MRWPFLAVLTATLAGPAPAADAPRWHGNYAEAKRLAKRLNKPMLVVFRCER